MTAVTGTALFFAQTKGALSLIVQNDKSYLALLIMVLFAGMTIRIGQLCFHADVAKEDEKRDLTKKAEIGWFTAEHFFSFGLLGTIIGLVLATGGSLDSTNPVSEIVAGLKTGLNTAFYTTICGIVFSILLQLQLLVLKNGLSK
jgi:flagellar motor component MotA